jgi:hypothetical protein
MESRKAVIPRSAILSERKRVLCLIFAPNMLIACLISALVL